MSLLYRTRALRINYLIQACSVQLLFLREKGRGEACSTEGEDSFEEGDHDEKGEDDDGSEKSCDGSEKDSDENEEDGDGTEKENHTKKDNHHTKESIIRMADLQRQLRENPYSAIVISSFWNNE